MTIGPRWHRAHLWPAGDESDEAGWCRGAETRRGVVTSFSVQETDHQRSNRTKARVFTADFVRFARTRSGDGARRFLRQGRRRSVAQTEMSSGSVLQQRNGGDSRRRRPGLDERVDVHQIRVGDDLLGVGRHLVGGPAHIGREAGERQVARRQPGTGGTPLALVAMALPAPVRDPELLACLRAAGGGLRGSARRPALAPGRAPPRTRPRPRSVHRQSSCASPTPSSRQRGCVTTSTSAGSPFLTTASARCSAGPRSLGFSIGPSA